MKKLNKKGFTIVELVIVITVIAILSAVMIPTFTGIVRKSKISAAEQEAANALHGVISLSEEGSLVEVDGKVDAYIVTEDYYFTVDNGEISEAIAIDDKTTPLPANVKADLTDLATLTTAGDYWVPAKLMKDDFDFSYDENANYPVYVYYNVAEAANPNP